MSSRSQAPSDLVELGRVAGAYGIKGWIRVHPYSTDSDTLLQAKVWWIKAPAPVVAAGALSSAVPSFTQVQVSHSRIHGGHIVAVLASVADRTAAEALKGYTVWVSRSDFASTEPDEYYWVDLIGCRVYGENNQGDAAVIGQVTDVMDNGAHGILRVARAVVDPDGTLVMQYDHKGRPVEVLIPFVAAHVHTIDLEQRQLFSNWPID